MSRNSNGSDSFAHMLHMLRFHWGETMPFCTAWFTKSYVKDKGQNWRGSSWPRLFRSWAVLFPPSCQSAECRFLLAHGEDLTIPWWAVPSVCSGTQPTAEVHRMVPGTRSSGLQSPRHWAPAPWGVLTFTVTALSSGNKTEPRI